MLFKETNFTQQLFSSNLHNFDELAISLFKFQFRSNTIYRQYCNLIGIKEENVTDSANIPFLPVTFFKSHAVQSGEFDAEVIYTSSSTTGNGMSKHFVKNYALYKQSFLTAFYLRYGSPSKYAVLGLLPSYLERDGSSLVDMVKTLMEVSNKPESGFYLHNLSELHQTITLLKKQNIPILLIGVTFALLDFASQFPINMRGSIVMETGGMKGKRKEMIRTEVHAKLKNAFQLEHIHSEYGMTELLSQAYAKSEGIYHSPPWMKVVTSDANDTLNRLRANKTGILNIIDLANIHSCAFVQTQDIGKVYSDGSFEVLGRLDQSDLRGCSLMYV